MTVLLEAIAQPFIRSASRDGFNGVVGTSLLKVQPAEIDLRAALAALIQSGHVSAVFSRVCENMHIKRFPDLPIDEQLKHLASEPLDEFCLYPTASAVQQRVDLASWHDRPFSKALLLGEAQLSFRGFDMGALERYVADPRYQVRFDDYMGVMSVTDVFYADPNHPERDKVSLQTFGLGFDTERRPHVVVYLRYLAGLSAEHQQYWNSYLGSPDVRMCEPYFRSSLRGEFWKNKSLRYAISEEMRLIRALTIAIWGQSLFRPPPDEKMPISLTNFLRPTADNFHRFVMEFDKMLSDSIDVKFFDGRLPLEEDTTRADGKIVVQKRGTLTLLQEWLLKEITWSDPEAFLRVVIQPLRETRRLRQTPAHTFTADAFSEDYYEKRKRLMWDVFNSLANIRAMLAKHPDAVDVKVPAWLDEGKIDVF